MDDGSKDRSPPLHGDCRRRPNFVWSDDYVACRRHRFQQGGACSTGGAVSMVRRQSPDLSCAEPKLPGERG